jgi:hypothetical protein
MKAVRLASLLVAAGALSSGPGAMLVVAWLAPQPAWQDVATFALHYRPVQVLPYALGLVLLTGFVLFAAACHAGAERELRARTSAGLVFTAIYASMVFTNYMLQLGVVPRALSGEPAYIEHLTMANPASLAWFLEMFGYAAMGVATYLVAPCFRGHGRPLVIRRLLEANGVVSVVGAACTAAFDRWVFTPWGIASFVAWNVLVPVCFGLIALSPDPMAEGTAASGDA